MESLNWILVYIYSLAHLLGKFFLKILDIVFSFSPFPVKLIDPIGFLIILTIFFLIFIFARGVAKWILIISWFLIFIKLAIVIFGS